MEKRREMESSEGGIARMMRGELMKKMKKKMMKKKMMMKK